MTQAAPIVHVMLAVVLCPLFQGIINRVKAVVGGRTGPPLLQPYFDLIKLLRKGAVYSATTTAVFKAGPVVSLGALLVALVLIPSGGVSAGVSFPGDLVLLALLLSAARFATILAALDTGSAFEGMGASREAWFSLLIEPAYLTGFAALAVFSGQTSLSGIYGHAWSGVSPVDAAPVLLLTGAAFLLLMLAENARIPVDDPDTHLELTMIHEVMVLDHCGVDLGFIQYGAWLKLWVTGSLVTGLLLPVRTGSEWTDLALGLAGLGLLAVVTGLIESAMARLRMHRVPGLLLTALALTVVSALLAARSSW
jgi:formate hydrogenlyase subunit 4